MNASENWEETVTMVSKLWNLFESNPQQWRQVLKPETTWFLISSIYQDMEHLTMVWTIMTLQNFNGLVQMASKIYQEIAKQ